MSAQPLTNAPSVTDLPELLKKFQSEYLGTEAGVTHVAAYAPQRAKARENFADVLRREAAGEDITDAVLDGLLPHSNTPSIRERGAWIHIAPAIDKDIRTWFQGKGWAKPDAWPRIAKEVLRLIRSATEDPATLQQACEEFSDLPESKGLQSGILTPILNSLEPTRFAIYNKKSHDTLSVLAGLRSSTKLRDYPEANAAIHTFVQEHPEFGTLGSELDILPIDAFDIFCHWFVAIHMKRLRAESEGPGTAKNPHLDEDGDDESLEADDLAAPAFRPEAFAVLKKLEETPTKECYKTHRDELKEFVEAPFQRIMLAVAGMLPTWLLEVLETEKNLFSRFPKNDFGRGGAWPFYWGAFYPKGTSRVDGIQLYMAIQPTFVSWGFYWATDDRLTLEKFGARVAALNSPSLSGFVVGSEHRIAEGTLFASSAAALAAGEATEASRIRRYFLDTETSAWSAQRLIDQIATDFQSLAVLLPLTNQVVLNPPATIKDAVVATALAHEEQPIYTLQQFQQETGYPAGTIETWVSALERKGQMILYGPPGTGKTFAASRLARHLVSESEGFYDVIQFHPSYTYEEFIQGIRPKSNGTSIDYPLLPGRFLDFCRRASERDDLCVLIIDEINRANLARVFGELMYLLEYRNESIHLAAGEKFRIPSNVRIIGTMNTADRSIALVDHALRRRFAFFALRPDEGVLTRYHAERGTDVKPLVELLRTLNDQIEPNYRVGHSYFLLPDLGEHLEVIWKSEIEPYLEEYFFDRQSKVEDLRWAKIVSKLGGLVVPKSEA